jgi:hypothetical protein
MRRGFLTALLAAALLTGMGTRLYAGNESPEGSVRSAAMGHASLSLQDVWSAMNNQAGLAHLERFAAGVYAEQRFSVEGLQIGGLAVAQPIQKLGVVGLTGQLVNFEGSYTQQMWGLAFARKFGPKVSAGIQVDLYNLSIQGYGSETTFLGELGLQYQLLPELRFGVHLFNPAAQKISETEDERTATVMQAGFAYEFSEKFTFAAEVFKQADVEARLQAGMEYRLHDRLTLYGGLQSNPYSGRLGLQLRLAPVAISIAVAYHEVLSATPMAGIDYLPMEVGTSEGDAPSPRR